MGEHALSEEEGPGPADVVAEDEADGLPGMPPGGYKGLPSGS
jgi:hypothetical protein